MQIRCYNCRRPFALNKEAVHAALELLTAQNMSHYNAPCPHCSKVNRVSLKELQRAAPNWRPAVQATEEASGE